MSAIFLLTAFVVQTFTGSLIRLDYYINSGTYAKNCINKARPKMHCNGNCQVMKKIREEEKKEQEGMENKFGNKMPVLSSRSFYPGIQEIFSTAIFKIYPPYNDVVAIQIPHSFFHPPCC